MKHTIVYNTQRDNLDFKGKFKAWWQCFTTCVWMLMSFFTSKVNGKDDKRLAKYLDDIETSIGKPGIGEKLVRKYKWITGATSFWWLIQRDALQIYLKGFGIKGKAIFSESKISFDVMPSFINRSPIILQTKKMGRLKGGHIILAVGYDSEHIICHDPFGNALSNYTDKNGKYVKYPKSYLRKYTGEKIRFIYFEEII